MTAEDIKRKQEEYDRESEKSAEKMRAEGKEPGMGSLLGGLMTTIVFGGKDTAADICPVLVVRMRSSEGRAIVDSVRGQMKDWNDNTFEGAE
jgi:hypothetical protein